MIEVVLPNGDRAECDRPALTYTAARLLREAAEHGAASRLLRAGLVVTDEHGKYDAAATNLAAGKGGSK